MSSAQPELRILVVEDEEDIRELLVSTLAEEAEVEGAADGLEALERLSRGPAPSVILLDMRLPRLSGEGVLQAIERLPVRPPVVTMSASAGQPPLGAAAHLGKPFTMGELLAVVRRVCLAPPAAGSGPAASA
ncbi:MAG TPA: response regulator [Anaeromyxobacter sp.]|nr:response regulator [Anaeromyxobacter sp.]